MPTGAIKGTQILSLTISLALVSDEVNTAVYARDIANFVACCVRGVRN